MAYPPGSGYPPSIQDLSQSCTSQGGQLAFQVNKQISGSTLTVTLSDATANVVWSSGGTAQVIAFTIANLTDGSYNLVAENGEAAAEEAIEVHCGVVAGSLTLAVGHTDETALNANDGTITLTPSGGTGAVLLEVVELSLSQPGNNGTSTSFASIPPATYTVRASDSSVPAQVVSSSVTVLPFVPVVSGCQDEYADNYDPAATSSNNSCTYTPRWRSAWQPLAVRVAAQAGQVEAFLEATLHAGFRPGHPLAADRPLADVATLRATVGPDGYATFVLGPYLRPLLGAGAGRLDLNSPTAYDADLYVGYELRRPDSTLLEHGYALNAAVLDGTYTSAAVPFPERLSPFVGDLPVWPGFDYAVPWLTTATVVGQYGLLTSSTPDNWFTVAMPCPLHPLPVAWLAPGGGYGFWVFQGKSQLGDEVGEGQQYREPATGQRRYADPGEAYQTYKASSGVFRGDALLTGLRTLWRSPQAWVLLGGQWLPIVVERGTREVGQLGRLRNEVPISFSLAMPEFAQGQ